MFVGKKVLANSPFYSVVAVTAVFMLLNTFLPLNLSATAEATKYPFKLRITLEKTTYKLGERVNVTWILTNIGEENITLYHSADHMAHIAIYDENLNLVYASESSPTADYYPFKPLLLGANFTATERWKRNYHTPGMYYIIGFFRSATYRLKLQTPQIRITIT